MPKAQPEEQYTPRGAKIAIPEREESRRNLDKLTKAKPPEPKSHKPNDDQKPL
jgi:hypothetical protein